MPAHIGAERVTRLNHPRRSQSVFLSYGFHQLLSQPWFETKILGIPYVMKMRFGEWMQEHLIHDYP